VLVNSDEEINHLKKTFVDTDGIKIKKVNYGIIRPKLNLSKLKLLKKHPYLKEQKYILFIGRIDPKKGLDLLINAFSKIKIKKNYCLVLSGPIDNKKYKEKIDKLIQSNKLKNKIFFTGFVQGSDKWNLIKFSEFTILPSYGENFGVSVVESLSVGKPVIISNKVGISKIIKKFSCGLVHQLNVNSLKRSMESLLSISYEKKNKLSKRALICFDKNYNLKINNSFSLWIKNNL
jgi:glycosyltransferase involved in cell wall biosynthesis